MKKFKTPLAITGSKKELEALSKPLMELGYKWNDENSYSNEDIIVTNFYGVCGIMGFTLELKADCNNRLKVPTSNPDLVLALAAMVDDSQIHKGEWVRDIQSKRPIYTAINYVGRSVHVGDILVRKATVEEILNHFNKTTMEKKVIGYNLKPQFEKREKDIAKLLDTITGKIPNGYWLPIDGMVYDKVKELNLLDVWFEPVYEEEKKIIKVKHRDGELEVEIKKGTAKVEEYTYVKEDLVKALLPIEASYSRYDFIPTRFDVGCKKDISREDIQKVIDALED